MGKDLEDINQIIKDTNYRRKTIEVLAIMMITKTIHPKKIEVEGLVDSSLSDIKMNDETMKSV